MTDLTTRPRIDNRKIEEIAATLAVVFDDNAWAWARPGTKGMPFSDVGKSVWIPNATDIALEIRDRIDELKPGMSINSGRIIVTWDIDEDGRQELKVQLDLGRIDGEAS